MHEDKLNEIASDNVRQMEAELKEERRKYYIASFSSREVDSIDASAPVKREAGGRLEGE